MPLDTRISGSACCHSEFVVLLTRHNTRRERDWKWDPDKERFINDEQANRMLSG